MLNYILFLFLSDGQGRSYDLSPLALDSRNWEAEVPTGTEKRFYINVCRSLVQQGGQSVCTLTGLCKESSDNLLHINMRNKSITAVLSMLLFCFKKKCQLPLYYGLLKKG